ncbi:MAG: LytR C-terminal domain-containing protein [Pseudonocardiaceae bacterium]
MATPGGGGRRLRTAGLALFGLAIIAALIGLVLALTRGERTTVTAKAPPVTATHTPVSTSATPSVIPFPPPVTSPSAGAPFAETPTTEPPPAEAPVGQAPVIAPSGPSEAAGGAPGSDNVVSRGEVRVYNNSTIRGLAARAAADLRAAGWNVIEVGNYAQGIIPTTTVYYQEGTDQHAEAEALADQFKMRVEPRFPGIANASPGLIVIVTNDYESR